MGPREWLLALISGFSALVAFKPSEPFLVSYMHCIKLIPSHSVIHEVFPVWTYAYLALLPCFSMLAELIGYRLVVLTGVLGRIVTLVIMLSPASDGSLLLMQLSQVTVAMGFAAHPSLSAIMFRSLPTSAYARAAGVVASAGVLAEVFASLLGQLMLSVGTGLTALFVVSCTATVGAFLLGCALPSPATRFSLKGSLDRLEHAAETAAVGGDAASSSVHAALASDSRGVLEEQQRGLDPALASPRARGELTAALLSPAAWSREGLSRGLLVCGDIGRVYRETSALRYYAWLAVGTAVHHLVLTYWQALKESWGGEHHHSPPPPVPSLPPHHYGGPPPPPSASCGKTSAFNGYVSAAASLLGGGVVLLPLVAERLLTVAVSAQLRLGLVVTTPLLMAGLLLAMSLTQTDAVFSSCYVAFHVIFEFMRVVCVAEGARCVATASRHGPPRFALISGLNLTVALALQTLLQLVFDQLPATSLPLNAQFQIFAALFGALHVAYVVSLLYRSARRSLVSHTSAGGDGGDGDGADGGGDSGSEAEARSYREITSR